MNEFRVRARREHENEAGVMCARCEAFAWCDRLLCCVTREFLMHFDPSCDAVLSTWCHSNCPHGTSHELFARFDAGAGGGPPAWRCFARETLSADLTTYVGGTTYCTRHQSLVDLHASCSADGFSPEPSVRPPSPSVPIPSAAPVAQPVDADGAMSCLAASDGVELEQWPVGSSSVVTVPAVDTRTWAPSSKRELWSPVPVNAEGGRRRWRAWHSACAR